MRPSTQDAYQLLHDGVLAFADMEEHGIHIDMDYCRKMDKHIARKIKWLEAKIESDPVVKEWKHVFRADTNLNSHKQLAHILFERLKYTPTVFTPTGKPATSQIALEGLKIAFTAKHVERGKLKAARNTFLHNIMQETVNGILHPFFHLHTTVTYRSSSSNINYHNLPKRDKYIQKLIRRAVKASPGNQILEVDWKGAEVCISYCNHHDPTLYEYIVNPKKDMHRDAACDCYKLMPKEVGKSVRYAGKSGWVFPQFYGDWFEPCAVAMWDFIDSLKLVTEFGIPLKQHLRSKGICTLQAFKKHLEKVENRFWYEQFPIYTQWKKDWVKRYNRRGWMKTLTGFVCSGILKDNEIVNYPIQGPTFHCLLWTLIETNKRIRAYKMKSRIMGQIHDSMVFDLFPKEKNDVLDIVLQIIEKDLPRHWDWITIPLGIEAELSPIDGTWYDMKEIVI